MNKTWLLSILSLSFVLLAIHKASEINSLTSFYRAEKVIKLQHFQKAKSQVEAKDQELLKLWESMLTGRSAPLSKWIKERYTTLGLNHLFTPSGFHLSAVLFPFLKYLPLKFHFLFICLLGIGSLMLPGMGALKRMILIKGHQKIFGRHLGFIIALLVDVLFGSFQQGSLSFTYSFLFIGIIYSGARGLTLIVWFFLAQMILAYFQGNDISILVLIFSPILNFAFGIMMPLLFLLAFPLWNWQLHSGIFILKFLQYLVDFCSHLTVLFPTFEIHIGLFIIIVLLMMEKPKSAILFTLILSNSLNYEPKTNLRIQTNELSLQGRILSTSYDSEQVKIVRSDGICKMKLVRGLWWENCSPRRKSSHKKFKKLSYPSREKRKSSLRG